MISRTDLDDLGDALIKRGLDEATVGDVLADMHDLSNALATVMHHYRLIAHGEAPQPLLDEIESEARDHMPGHVRSLRSTVPKVRGQLRSNGSTT